MLRMTPSLKACLLCIPWYTCSSMENVVNKMFFGYYPLPVTISMIQMATIVTILYPSSKMLNITCNVRIFDTETLKYFLPLALMRAVSSIMTHASINLLAVSYANTIKTTMPLITLVLSKKIFKVKYSVWEFASVLCIMFGVSLATVTEISFDMNGVCFTIFAMLGQICEIFISKLAFINLKIEPINLLFNVHLIAFFITQTVWVLFELNFIMYNVRFTPQRDLIYFIAMLLASAVASLVSHASKALLNSILTPLGYSMAKSAKSIFVIMTSLLLLKNPVTFSNLTGTILALFGLGLYDRMKLKRE